MIEHSQENDIERYPHWRIAQWPAELPAGRIERIYTHWSAHDYRSVFPAYHFCVAIDATGEIVLVNTHDLTENMRNVYDDPDRPYAAHTRKRNSFALGISVMAMEGARPDDFGVYPLTGALIDGLCTLAARLCAFYSVNIDADHVMSHAEAALHDGYFGTKPQERWDIARLRPEKRPLEPRDAIETGEFLRSRMRKLQGEM
ncbi:MAG TPA: hypothetical protein VFE17_06425 [Candidatus Baltobacteraceae bacterium]|jgi:hypothetical protein|nr:hypothetical protein [Candidatus Baltobacteraceae bacterium]